MKRFSANVVIGGVLLVFCVVVYLIIPLQVPELMRYDASMGLSPAVFPKLAVILIAAFSLGLLLSGLRSQDIAPAKKQRALYTGAATRVITTFIILVAYVYLIEIFGYLMMTPLALVLLMRYFGQKNWFLILSLAILITAGLYAFFRYLMYIILPEGIFFS
jgi:putative tricarboxylic transport membrane protein